MASIDQIRKQFGGLICRECINKVYRANLLPDNCIYISPYLRTCRRCDQPKHIVRDFTFLGKLKMKLK